MMPLGRFGALLLGLALALAWSSAASAGKPKKSKKGGSHPAVVGGGGSSGGGGFHAPSRSAPSRPSAHTPRASHGSSRGSSGGSHGAPSGLHRSPSPHRSSGAPSAAKPGLDAPSWGGDGTSGLQRTPPHPGVSNPGTRPGITTPGTRPMVLPRKGKGPSRAAPSPLPRAALPQAPKVPPVVERGGTVFKQHVVAQGPTTVVRRTPPPHGEGHGQGAGHRGRGHGHEHHDHYYHHRYWVHGYYYCYVHYWVYDPWFWGFYFAPFAAPWPYAWVWIGAPWYVAWGWYYHPYPYYAAPSYWVTDYVISSTLEDEYARGYAAGYDDGLQEADGTPISDPVKEQLREQVDDTAQAFQTEQPVLLENALADPEHLFIVDTPISVATAGAGTCSLSGGDIIKAAGPTDPAVPVATMTVVTSKGSSCAAGSVVSISYTDLQEMMNTFGERVDDGLNEMQKQGQTQQEGAEP